MADDLFDAAGEKVEGALDPDAAKDLQEKADKAEELTKTIEEKEAELKKLADKDLNFSNFRNKSKEEKEEMMKDWGEKEKILMSEIDGLKERNETDDKAVETATETAIEVAVKKVAGEDEDFQKEVKDQYETMGKQTDPMKIATQMEEAKILVEHRKERVQQPNQINQFAPTTGEGNARFPNADGKNAADTPDGKKFAGELGMQTEAPKKKE